MRPIRIAAVFLGGFVSAMIWILYGKVLTFEIFKTYSSKCNLNRTNVDLCNVQCTTGIPCEYLDELDFRIIVLTFNRPNSLAKSLSHLEQLDTLGDQVGIDIWIDRAKDGNVDCRTIEVSTAFQNRWTNGRTCIHIQDRNAYIIGQWVDTWRPRENSRELALILEDDIDISPLTYKWLKLMDSQFSTTPNVAGYTLQMENVKFIEGRIHPVTNIPKHHNIFLYRLFGTWGYSPKPNEWRNFQDWFHDVRQNQTFRPYLPDLAINSWFVSFEKQNRSDSMWEMWVIHYHYISDLYTVYSNLPACTGLENTLLDTNRKEAGLHFKKRFGAKNKSPLLLRNWHKDMEKFPDVILEYEFDGTSHPANLTRV